MKKTVWIVVFALVASVVGLVLVTSSGAIVREEKLTYVMQPIDETGIDINGDHELTPGDGWVSNNALRRDGEVVGNLVSSCQFIKVRADGMGGLLQCVSTAKIPGGQITAQTRFPLIEGQTNAPDAAITGGTGAFANARGYVSSEPIQGTPKVLITFYLIP